MVCVTARARIRAWGLQQLAPHFAFYGVFCVYEHLRMTTTSNDLHGVCTERGWISTKLAVDTCELWQTLTFRYGLSFVVVSEIWSEIWHWNWKWKATTKGHARRGQVFHALMLLRFIKEVELNFFAAVVQPCRILCLSNSSGTKFLQLERRDLLKHDCNAGFPFHDYWFLHCTYLT